MKLQSLTQAPLNTIFATLFVALSLSSCTNISTNNSSKDSIVHNNHDNGDLIDLATTHNDQAKLYEMIVLGRIAVSRQNYKQALEFYLKALELRTDQELAREALILSEQLNNHVSSMHIATLWVNAQPKALMPWKLIAYYSLADKSLEKTLKAVEKVIALETDFNEQLSYFIRLAKTQKQSPALELFQSLASSYPNNPAIQLAIASIYQQREEWQKALSITAQVVDSNPQLLVGWTFHGSSLIVSGEKTKAIKWFQKALKIFPKSNDIRDKLGHLLYDLDRFSEAREQFEQIVSNSHNAVLSQLSESQYMIAACYYSEKNYPLSRRYFEPLLKMRRHRNPVLFYLGEMARRDSDFNSAINFYKQIKPSRYYQTAHSLVAQLLQQQGQYQKAIDYLEQVQPQDKASEIEFKLTRFRIMNGNGETEQAEKYLAELLIQYPDDIDIQLYNIQWMLEKGKADELVTLLPDILTYFPLAEQKKIILSVASMLHSFAKTDMAIDLLNAHISHNDTDFLYMRALIAADIGDIALAERDLRLIIEIAPENNDAINALGYTLADANLNLPEALALIKKAYSINPDSAAIIDSMGWVLYRQGKLSESITYLKQAFKADSSAEIASHLGEVLWKMNEEDQAKDIFRTALNKTPKNKMLNTIIKQLGIRFEAEFEKP